MKDNNNSKRDNGTKESLTKAVNMHGSRMVIVLKRELSHHGCGCSVMQSIHNDFTQHAGRYSTRARATDQKPTVFDHILFGW